jgi:hypothetical protein
MIKWYNWRTILGAVLVLFGLVALGQAMGYLSGSDKIVSSLVAVLFAAGGLGFLSMLFQDRKKWWALIPGMVLLSIGVLIASSTFFPGASDRFGGAIFLGGISLAFWLVYFMNRQYWWAVIPGGVLLTLALITTLSGTGVSETGGAFFFGLGLTFAVVALLPNREVRLNWAWIPAGILLVMGALFSLSAGGYVNFVWPVALILAGAFLVYRAFRKPV